MLNSFNDTIKEMQSLDKETCDYASKVMTLAEESKSIKYDLDERKGKRINRESIIKKVQHARVLSTNAAGYWKSIDPIEYGKWLCVVNAADMILLKIDDVKNSSKIIIDRDEQCCAVAENKSDSDEEGIDSVLTKSKAFVKSSDGRMVTVDELFPPSKKAIPSNRFSRKLKTSGKKRTIEDISCQAFTMYLNGGQYGISLSCIMKDYSGLME